MSEKISFNQPSVIINTLVALIFVIAVTLYFYFFKFDSNITGFFRIGSVLPLSPYLNPEQILIYKEEIGYDGQQFLSIAFDPFLQNPETLNALDHPAYRYRRILYPLLSYCLSLGNSYLIPYVMVAINAISIILIVWVVSLYFQAHPSLTWQPLLTLCIPGVWIVLSLGTADLVSSLLLITALVCYRYDKPKWTAIAIALACLTRETLLLMWLALLLTSIRQQKSQQIKHLLWAWLPAFFWLLSIKLLNLPGSGGIKANFGYPFVGIFQKFFAILMNGFQGNNLFEAYLFLLLITIFITIYVLSDRYRKDHRYLQFFIIFYSVMFIFTSMTILGYYLDYSRVFMDVYFLILLSFNRALIPWKMILLSLSGVGSLAFLALHS